MIDCNHKLPITRQTEILNIRRGSVHYLPKAMSEVDLPLIRRIDARPLEHPFVGSRMLRDLRVTQPNQIWARDITFVPMARGVVYLAAVVNGCSRQVLAQRVSITMEADFCIEAVEETIPRYGKPGIFNTVQGNQFTSSAFTGLLNQHNIRISMDGRGAWRDNVFVERLWKSVKYEEVYLKTYGTVSEAKLSLAQYFEFYNRRRPHSSLNRMAPEQFYFNQQPEPRAA